MGRVCLGTLPVTNLSWETGKSIDSAADLISRLRTVWNRLVKLGDFPAAPSLLASQFRSVRKQVRPLSHHFLLGLKYNLNN